MRLGLIQPYMEPWNGIIGLVFGPGICKSQRVPMQPDESDISLTASATVNYYLLQPNIMLRTKG